MLNIYLLQRNVSLYQMSVNRCELLGIDNLIELLRYWSVANYALKIPVLLTIVVICMSAEIYLSLSIFVNICANKSELLLQKFQS